MRILVVTNSHGFNSGIFTDGDLKRLMQKKRAIDNLKINFADSPTIYILLILFL